MWVDIRPHARGNSSASTVACTTRPPTRGHVPWWAVFTGAAKRWWWIPTKQRWIPWWSFSIWHCIGDIQYISNYIYTCIRYLYVYFNMFGVANPVYLIYIYILILFICDLVKNLYRSIYIVFRCSWMFLDVFATHLSYFWSVVKIKWIQSDIVSTLGSSFRAMPAPVVEETPGVASCWIHTLMVRGFTLQQLRVAGFELSALRAFGFTPKSWRSWDVPDSQLGFSQGWI